jgi:hypothetical protein
MTNDCAPTGGEVLERIDLNVSCFDYAGVLIGARCHARRNWRGPENVDDVIAARPDRCSS